jgi:hypothetical protein
MQARHFVIDDGNADRVVAAADITVKHLDLPLFVFARRPACGISAAASLVGCLLSELPGSKAQKKPASPTAVVAAGLPCPPIFHGAVAVLLNAGACQKR